MSINSLDKQIVAMAMDFFNSKKYRLPSREDAEYISHYAQFMGDSRELLKNMLLQVLPCIEPTMPKDRIEFIVDAHGDTLTNKSGLLTGHSGGVLSDKGIERAKDFFKDLENLPDVIITSDSPRAIHHAIAKYFPRELDRLTYLIDATPVALEKDYGLINKETQIRWLNEALRLGMIPTPLLRAQYYGLMELFPEKTIEERLKSEKKKLEKENFTVDEIDEKLRESESKFRIQEEKCYTLQKDRFEKKGLGKKKISAELGRIRTALPHRSDPKSCMRDYRGWQITEQRVNLDQRGDYFMTLMAPGEEIFNLIMGKRVQIVSHSGTNDVLFEFFKRYENPQEIHLQKRPKPPVRGESFLMVMDAPNKKIAAFRYLNDPSPLEDALEKTANSVKNFRERSADEMIRSGKGVVPAEFYALNRKESGKEDEKSQIGIEELITDNKNYLILGDCGIGKTTFSVDLTAQLMMKKDYVPSLIQLGSVSSQLNLAIKSNPGVDKHKLLMEILTNYLCGLDDKTIDVFKARGKKFVFILDGYDELDLSLKQEVLIKSAIKDMQKIGKVILTSRNESFSKYEGGNSALGFERTMHIDQDVILKNLDSYLEQRFENPEDRSRLKEYIMMQNPDIKDNWMMVYFITDIYKRERESIDIDGKTTSSHIMKKGIEWFVWDHASKRDDTLCLPLPKAPEESVEEFAKRENEYILAKKDAYIREVIPTLQKIAAYMTINDKPLISTDEVQMIIDRRWNLVNELTQRKVTK